MVEEELKDGAVEFGERGVETNEAVEGEEAGDVLEDLGWEAVEWHLFMAGDVCVGDGCIVAHC